MPKHYHMKAETGNLFGTPGDAKLASPKSFTFPVIPQEVMLEKPMVTFNLRIPMMGAFFNKRSATVVKDSTKEIIAKVKLWQINSYMKFKINSKLLTVGEKYLVTIQ